MNRVIASPYFQFAAPLVFAGIGETSRSGRYKTTTPCANEVVDEPLVIGLPAGFEATTTIFVSGVGSSQAHG
jgi:hypothetical protein